MKVFISWSGQRSGQVASALRNWLPGVLQVIEPWLSSQDLPLGARWADEIARSLQSTDVGIICLTPENLQSPWLMYEAGALSKRIGETLVCTYALGIPLADITGPLAQFQSALAQRDDTLRLIRTLNAVPSGPNLSDAVLQRVFDANWPWLEERLSTIQAADPQGGSAPARPSSDKLDEILTLVRTIVRSNQTDIYLHWSQYLSLRSSQQ